LDERGQRARTQSRILAVIVHTLGNALREPRGRDARLILVVLTDVAQVPLDAQKAIAPVPHGAFLEEGIQPAHRDGADAIRRCDMIYKGPPCT
jgi:hypothetical protein